MISYTNLLPDRRLARRAEALVEALTRLRSISIAQLATDWAEQVAFYRFLGNSRVTVERLAAGLFSWMNSSRSLAASKQTHVLLIQDTTEVSFEAHSGRIQDGSGLGWLSNNRQLGFCLHPALVVDAQAGRALGFADLHVWSRPPEGPDKHQRRYRDLPIEEKESFRWIEAVRNAMRRLGAGEPTGTESPSFRLTTIGDREADIYSLFARLPAGSGAIIRACRDRRIMETPGHLYAFLSQQPSCGTETVWLRGDLRQGRRGRFAKLSYRFGAVTLQRPERSAKPDAESGKRDPRSLRLWALEVTEQDPPQGSKPVCWRLLSTHPIEDFGQARQACSFYRQRWHIEQIFRLLKRDGLDLEASELESGEAIMRLGVLALGAALDVFRLLMAERSGSDEADQLIEEVFDEGEQACLQRLSEKVQGRTPKQRNPHAQGTLAWAAWIIARLGGWKGYASQRRAGPATYHRGLQRFHAVSDGWRLAHRDLYKP